MSRFMNTIVFVSTWEFSPGIKSMMFDPEAKGGEGEWKRCHELKTIEAPVFIRLNGRKDVLYALCNFPIGPERGEAVSTLFAIHFDVRKKGRMKVISSVNLVSDKAFYMCFSQGDTHVAVGQKGSIEIYSLDPDGKIGAQTQVHRSCRVGTGMIDHTSPTQLEFILGEREPKIMILNTAKDLNVMTIHDFDMDTGVILDPDEDLVSSWKVENGFFSKFVVDCTKLVVINNSTSKIYHYAPNQENTTDEIRTVAAEHIPRNVPVDLISPFQGDIVYVSNKGHNSISCFPWRNGRLTLPYIKDMPKEKPPKDMVCEGENLFVTSENDIYIFEIDPENLTLEQSSPEAIDVSCPLSIAVVSYD